MKANETKITQFLELNKIQFVIPVYQRNYDWSIPQCQQLLNDILEVAENNNINAHFIGSIVFIHDDLYTSNTVKELTIIDGQQRLTTLTLIYLAIYELAQKINHDELANEIIDTYIINKYIKEENYRIKLKLTDNNASALQYLIRNDSQEEFNQYSRIIDNFIYFQSRINQDNYSR